MEWNSIGKEKKGKAEREGDGKGGEGRKGKGREGKRKIQLEVTFRKHLVQLPNHVKASQMLEHIIKSIIQMPLEH